MKYYNIENIICKLVLFENIKENHYNIDESLFCSYITIYNGNKLPKFYIGSTKVDNIKNNNYKGSVSSRKYGKIWKDELKNYPELFKIIILNTFDNRNDAYDNEEYLQKNIML